MTLARKELGNSCAYACTGPRDQDNLACHLDSSQLLGRWSGARCTRFQLSIWRFFFFFIFYYYFLIDYSVYFCFETESCRTNLRDCRAWQLFERGVGGWHDKMSVFQLIWVATLIALLASMKDAHGSASAAALDDAEGHDIEVDISEMWAFQLPSVVC